MRLRARLTLFVAAAAVLPLAIVTVVTAGVTERAVTESILRAEIATAQGVADSVARHVAETERGLRAQLANFRLDTASDEARSAFLVTTWRLYPDLAVATLVDADGTELVPPVHEGNAGPTGRAPVSPERLARVRGALAVPAAGEVGYGSPSVDASGTMLLPFVVASPRGDGIALAGDLSLDSLTAGLGAFRAGARAIVLCDAQGRVLAGAGDASWVDPSRLRAVMGSSRADYRYVTADGLEVLGASARVPVSEGAAAGWSVLVAEPASQVGLTAEAVRARAAYIGVAAILFAGLAGGVFAGALARPIGKLRAAAVSFGKGALGTRVEVEGGGELAELAEAFNAMSESLARSQAEIAGFNAELQGRVDARTAELRAAQDDLVRAGRLAAVAELGAGLAHELNNPLASVLGAVQVARAAQAPPHVQELLSLAEQEAQRCRVLVGDLLRVAEARLEGDAESVQLAEVVAECLHLAMPSLRRAGVRAEVELSPVIVQAPRGAVFQAFSQMLASARSVARGGELHVRSGVEDGAPTLTLSVARLSEDEDTWRASALSGWLAQQIFAQLRARVELPVRGAPEGRWTARFHTVEEGA